MKTIKPKHILTNGKEEISIYTGIEKGKIWLETEEGEGSEFPEKDVYTVLRDYYEKNF